MVPARSENPKVRDDSVPRADDRHGFLGGKEAVLIERLMDRELVPFAIEPFQVFLRHMAMPGGDVHDQLRRAVWSRHAEIAKQALAYEPLNARAVNCCGGHVKNHHRGTEDTKAHRGNP